MLKMTDAPAPVKTKKQPKQRTLSYNRLTGILHVADARGEKGYYVDRLDCDFVAGGAAYRLTKLLAKPGEPDHYDVVVSPEGDLCECLGHLKHAHRGVVCRHIASVRTLLQLGKLS